SLECSSLIVSHRPTYELSQTLFVLSYLYLCESASHRVYPLSLHDALPICSSTFAPRPTRWSSQPSSRGRRCTTFSPSAAGLARRSEEHTSELQSRFDLVCRLLLEKKKKTQTIVQ